MYKGYIVSPKVLGVSIDQRMGYPGVPRGSNATKLGCSAFVRDMSESSSRSDAGLRAREQWATLSRKHWASRSKQYCIWTSIATLWVQVPASIRPDPFLFVPFPRRDVCTKKKNQAIGLVVNNGGSGGGGRLGCLLTNLRSLAVS